MFTYEQIPFTRVMAKMAFSDGKLSKEKYDKLMSLLEQSETDHNKIDKQIIKAAGKSFLNRRMPVIHVRRRTFSQDGPFLFSRKTF
ncbi:hypothetical protein CBW46_008875 [Paenibacillus xerothermodurans]|uniref:Uncharacterized protein n=1 Tax=Paenibacillus xerothermodurans TaxID=1977292 RepID=A0A2W1NCR8_PAEXE|nr:hypothetical protein CBW46_008875 [Paenibacillus xerothermodurans]